MNEKTVCNQENGSTSSLWNRRCWIADSMLSLVDSHLEYLYEIHENMPEEVYTKLHRYIEELRVDNGLRSPGVINWERKKAA